MTIAQLGRSSRFTGCAIASMLAIALLGACAAPGHETVFQGSTMGTTYTVKVVDERALEVDRAQDLRELIDTRLTLVDHVMSTYRSDSEISELNRAPADTPYTVRSEHLMKVLSVAQEVSAMSDGAFDVTVGPLVDAWGFGPPTPGSEPPSPEELEALAGAVGYHKLQLEDGGRVVTKASPDLRVDLSAIAKGFAVDLVFDTLGAQFDDLMVEVGGEVRTGGANAAAQRWRIAIEAPTAGRRSLHRIVELSGAAMATSGDYRNFYEIDGQRYSHQIDPRTLRPITHRTASVTVIHESTMWADALATALMILGPADGLVLAEERNLAVLFLVYADDGAVDELASSAMRPYLTTSASPRGN